MSALIAQNNDKIMNLSKFILSHENCLLILNDIDLLNRASKLNTYKLKYKQIIYFELAKF